METGYKKKHIRLGDWVLRNPYKRSDGYYHVRARRVGTKLVKNYPTREKDLRRAVQAAYAWLQTLANPEKQAAPVLFRDAIEEFFSTKSAKAEKTLKLYRRYTDELKQAWSDKVVNEIEEKDVRAFFDDLKTRLQTSTREQYLIYLRSFLRWAQYRDWIVKSPAAMVKLEKSPRPKRYVLSVDDVRKLLKVSRERVVLPLIKDPAKKRVYASSCTPPDHLTPILLTLWHTALRIGNVLGSRGLRRAWLNLVERRLNIPAEFMKNRVELEIPLHPELAEALKAYIDARPNLGLHEPLFPVGEIYWSFETALTRAELPQVRIHDIRRAANTQLRKRFPEAVASAFLGHSARSVNDLYTAIDFQFLRECIDSLPRVLTPPGNPAQQEAKQA